MTDIVEVCTTLETEEQAHRLAKSLVESKLAACVQIEGPVRSVYNWKGELCDANEYRCTIKSMSDRVQALIAAIHQQHPYDVPEILVTEVKLSSEAYTRWIADCLSEPPADI